MHVHVSACDLIFGVTGYVFVFVRSMVANSYDGMDSSKS